MIKSHYTYCSIQQLTIRDESHLIICKCDKCKRSERFGDKDISDFTILHEVLPQFISCHVLCTAANKDFTTSHGLIRTCLRGQKGIWLNEVIKLCFYFLSTTGTIISERRREWPSAQSVECRQCRTVMSEGGKVTFEGQKLSFAIGWGYDLTHQEFNTIEFQTKLQTKMQTIA